MCSDINLNPPEQSWREAVIANSQPCSHTYASSLCAASLFLGTAFRKQFLFERLEYTIVFISSTSLPSNQDIISDLQMYCIAVNMALHVTHVAVDSYSTKWRFAENWMSRSFHHWIHPQKSFLFYLHYSDCQNTPQLGTVYYQQLGTA